MSEQAVDTSWLHSKAAWCEVIAAEEREKARRLSAWLWGTRRIWKEGVVFWQRQAAKYRALAAEIEEAVRKREEA